MHTTSRTVFTLTMTMSPACRVVDCQFPPWATSLKALGTCRPTTNHRHDAHPPSFYNTLEAG